MNKLVSTVALSACLVAITATTAMAQTPASADSRAASPTGRGYAARPFSRPTERVEARLAYVKTALKITDGQQAQWDAYANFVRKNAQDREQRFKARQPGESGRARHPRPNAIERLERTQSVLAETVTRISQLLAVEKPLYAALSPEQQKIADEVLRVRHRTMGGRGGFGRG